MIDLQTISIVFAGLSIGLAAIYYILTLRATRQNIKMNLETRQFQLLMQLSQYPMSKEGQRDAVEWSNMEWTDYDDFENKYGSDLNPDNYALRQVRINWYNVIGLLVKHGMIDKELVYDYVGTPIIQAWNLYGEITKLQRELYRVPNAGASWEYLYEEMVKIAQRRGQDTKSKVTTRYTDELKQKVTSHPDV